MLGLVYVWVKGDLEWIRSIKGDPRGMQNVSSRTRPRETRLPRRTTRSRPLAAREPLAEGAE